MEYGTKNQASLREPINADNNDDIENLSIKLSDNSEAIVEAIQSLEEYELRLGGDGDNEKMRNKMREQLLRTDNLIKRTGEILKQFEAIKPKKKEELDYRNRILKRTKENFTKQNDKYNKLSKDIQSKGKIYGDVKKPVISSGKQGNLSNASTDLEGDVQTQVHDLDYNELYLREREEDIQEVRRLAHELNLKAQVQAQKLQENSQDIVIIQESINETEANTDKANKELTKVAKSQKRLSNRNLICLVVVVVACAATVWIVLANNS